MKVSKTGGATPVTGGSAVRAETAYRNAAQPQPVPRAEDVATVMGIPESELTPKVRKALQQLMAEVYSLRQEVEEARQRAGYLEQLADQDSLAPVLNRRAFVRELGRMAAFEERYGAAGAVLYFDVNDLKVINDTHGHAAGDAVLKRVCEVLLRDTRASDVVGRLGGDEFGVILAQSGLDAAADKAGLLAGAIAAEEVVWEGAPLHVSVAYGVHALSGDQQADDALKAADRAMYANKRGGREES
ncbi:GGDEF domain-containing protein [Pelagibius sp. CAU 1746]|uniref:GGDEF domain-containing protein n=1 Tax=Pelagibius sp. CAU 1746 TaxID=3140370 RepID=UPI00325A663D